MNDLNVHLTINSKTRRHVTQPQSRVRWHSPALSLCACPAGCSWAASRQESGLGGRPTLLEKGGCGRWHGSGWPASHRECVHARSRTGPHGRVVRTRCQRWSQPAQRGACCHWCHLVLEVGFKLNVWLSREKVITKTQILLKTNFNFNTNLIVSLMMSIYDWGTPLHTLSVNPVSAFGLAHLQLFMGPIRSAIRLSSLIDDYLFIFLSLNKLSLKLTFFLRKV